jgi:predicted enzyme related to lactoylglutathione lyase
MNQERIMHKSRLCGFVIDCRVDDFDAAAQFWSRALGRELKAPVSDSPTYRTLETSDQEPILLLQKVDHQSRIHLDIESDDVEAEVARLEALGARRVAKVQTWWVMEAPTGHRFCVVRLQRGPLGDGANQWP